MAQLTLSLENLGLLDHGLAEIAANTALATCARDLADRGMGCSGDGKPREVTIKVTMVCGKSGDAEVDVQVSTKMPAYRTRPTIAVVKQRGENAPASLLFRDTSPDEPRQRTLDEVETKDEE